MQIINPWIFYLINILENIMVTGIVLFVILVVTAIVMGVMVFDPAESVSDEKKKLFKKLLKRVVIPIVVVCTLAITFIPSEKTMYTMLVSSYVTTDNLETATEVIQDGVDYIFDKLDSDEEGD